MKIKFSVAYSTCLGCGYFPKMPGTMGTLLAFIVYLFLPDSIFKGTESNFIFLGVLLLISIISVPIITRAERYLGHDNGKIVMDEFLGYMLGVAFLPKGIITGLIIFVLFRIFDIFKIEPVNMLQKLPGGAGVMADDLMAGVYSNLIARLIIIFIL
ncbi:MAG: phosphatidylglycerophosphatase A [Candidatus Stygibacter australis]|nr:phosphatidylglycerophosphatase A [Candidatus Stygibacter australis]MDP8321267.1 phosphatidylglycerophosphatase A [Candidatus Stygibacter australis]